ncbi:MAG: hypothetical protein GYB35_11595 [Algicola sp.]|nr:hypothetical protein [Algicola sp.]
MNLIQLQDYVTEKFVGWREEYGNNLVGVHIGYKKRDGEFVQRYSVVFHVSRKYENPSNPFPETITIETIDGTQKILPTDVIETGTLKLQSYLGSRIRLKNDPEYGSLGFYLYRNRRLYFCSNMHVVAPHLLREKTTYYYKHYSLQKSPDIAVLNHDLGYLEEAYFDYMDIGIVRIKLSAANNNIPNHGKPKGFYRINNSNINIIKSIEFKMFGTVSGFKSTQVIEVNGSKVATRYDNTLYASRLLIMKKCSQEGDSGAPIFDPKNLHILGIVIGSDSSYTYAIPVNLILNRFNAKFFNQ